MTGEIRVSNPDIYIDADGVWFADGKQVIHENIFHLFCDSLVFDAAGGHMLRIGNEECPVRVADAPFLARRIFTGADGALKVKLNDGSVEDFHPETLSRCGDTAIYFRIRSGQLRARIGRTAYPNIIANIEYEMEEKRYYFQHGGKKYPIDEE